MRYRLKGRKFHTRINGKRVTLHRGDVFEMDPGQMKGFKDLVEPLDPDPPPPEPKVGLKAVHRGGGKYDVVNETTGKKINDALLTKNEAFELVKKAEADENPKEEIEKTEKE